MTIDEMKRCIDEVIRLGNSVRKVNELDQRAEAHPAPSRAKLAQFAAQIGDAVPPSLLRLLALHDGITCFDYVDVDIFSIEYLAQHEQELEDEWVDAGKFARDEIYVFGRSDFDSLALAFLRQQRRADGEMPVVMIDARGVLAEYFSLTHYLQSRREWFQEQVDLERGDRDGLRNDE
jgi:hypothetical protein